MLTERHKAMFEIAEDLERKGYSTLSLDIMKKVVNELSTVLPEQFRHLLPMYLKEHILIGVESFKDNRERKIAGIKQIRVNTRPSLGLKEAKDLYEAIEKLWRE